MHKLLLRVLFGLTLVMGTGLTPAAAVPPAPAPAASAISAVAPDARAARTPHLTTLCLARSSRKLSAPRSGECRRPLRTRQLRVTDRLAVCLTDRSARLVRGAACRRTDGVVRRLPGRKAVTVCARGKQRLLRHVSRPARCTKRERAFRIGDRAPRDVGVSGLQLVENVAPGSVVGALVADDPDAGDFLNFALVSGDGSDDNDAFTLDGPALRTVGRVDHETKSAYRVRVRARDALGRSTSAALTLAVTDQDENRGPGAISLTPGSIAENKPAVSVVGTLSTADPDAGDTHSYELLSNGAPFEVQGDRLRTTRSLDHEGQSSHTLSIRSTDSAGESVTAPVTVTVTDVDEAPTDIALSASTVEENAAVGTIVGSLSTSDPDAGESFTYELLSGTSSFEAVGAELRTTAVLDSLSTPVIDVEVRSTDSAGLSTSRTFAITVADVDEAPDTLSLSGGSVDENLGDALVGDLSATDPDGTSSFTFSLVPGAGDADNGEFVVVGDELRTKPGAGLDHEVDETRSVRVQVEDAGGLALQRAFDITVGDVNEAPGAPAPGAASVDENVASGTEVVTFTAADPDNDPLTYSLVSGTGDADNAKFSLSDAGVLTTAAALDHETQDSASVRVRVSDGALSAVRVVAITVADLNEAPSDLSLSPSAIAENNAPGALVGTLTTSDEDAGDTAAFELVSGVGDADNGSFRIDGDRLEARQPLDHETKAALDVRVRVTDSGGQTHTRALIVTVTDIAEGATEISLTPAAVAENSPIGTTVGTLSDDDPEGGTSYSLVSGDGDGGNGSFEIVGNEVRATASLNHETQDSWSIRVRVDDGSGHTFTQALIIAVTDVNEPSTDVTLSSVNVLETSPVGTVVGMLGTTDPDDGDSFGYALFSGTGSFEVVGNELRTTTLLDATVTPTIDVMVTSTDGAGHTVSRTFTITVDDVNEAPTDLFLSNSSVDENLGDALVGTLSATDPDGTSAFSFSLVSGAGDDGNGEFVVVGNVLRTKPGAGLDHEVAETRSVRLQVEDAGGLTFQRALDITVGDVNEAPTTPAPGAASVDENVASGTEVVTFTATDPDSDPLTFSLVSGSGDADNAKFSLSDAGVLTTAAALDHESQDTASIRVQVSDGPLTTDREVTVSIADLNEASTAITLSPDHIDENNAPGAVVGTLTGNDPDAGETLTYALVTGTGSDDNDQFEIVGGELRATATLDREPSADQPLTVRVRVTDDAGLTFEEELTVTVDDVNEKPTALTWTDGTTSAKSIDENEAAGSVVASVKGSDPDEGDTLTFALQSGDTGKFTLNGTTGELKTAESFDYEAMSPDHSWTITVRVTDAGGLHLDQALTIDVNDVNDAPKVVNDAYTGAIGNTLAKAGDPTTTGPVVTLTGALPLANDSDEDAGDTISVKAVTDAPTSQGGTITIGTDGKFVYLPPLGKRSLDDTFTYTVADNHGLESTGTLTISIGSRVVWYVDAAAAAGGDGRSTAPLQGLAPLDGASGADQTGDQIYIYSGSYSAGIQLLSGQKLTGAGVALGGLLTAGTAPTVGASSGNVVGLAADTVVEGLKVTATGTAVALRANNVGAATVADSVAITGGSGDAVSITGGGGALAIGAPVTAGTGRAVSVSGRTSGSVTIAGLVTQAGTSAGVNLSSNSGSIAFSGGLRLKTGSTPGFVATNSGTLSVTGAGSTIESTTGTALSVSNTTIASTGLTFASISSNGAASGIVLTSTGTTGSLQVTGTTAGACGSGTAADCTGGSIIGSTGPGISLSGTRAPSFTRMRVIDGAGDGISAAGLTHGLKVAHSIVDDNGDANDENGIDLVNPAGAVSVTSSTVARSGDVNVHLGASSGVSSLAVTGSRINAAGSGTGAPAGGTGSIRDGVLANVGGTANVTVNVNGNTFAGNLGDHVQLASSGGTVTSGSTINNNTLTGGTSGALGQGIVVNAAASPWTGSLKVAVNGNTISGSRASGISLSQAGTAGAASFHAVARNNTIGTAVESCSQTANGITVGNDQSSTPMVLAITDNTIRNCYARGINMTVGDGASSVQATVSGNIVSGMPADARPGFEANIGTTSADTGTSCLAVSGNTLTGGGASAGLRIRHRYAGLLLPGYTGAPTAYASVQTFLAGQNPATSLVEVTEPISGTFGNSAGCTVPSV